MTTRNAVQYINVATKEGPRPVPVFWRHGGLAIHPSMLLLSGAPVALAFPWVTLTAEHSGLRLAGFASVDDAANALREVAPLLDWGRVDLKSWPPPKRLKARSEKALKRHRAVR